MRLWKRIIEYALIRTLAAAQRFQGQRTPPDPQQILAFEMFGIGDLICALPAVRALRAHYPRAHIALVVGRASLSLAPLPYCDEVIAGPFSSVELWRFWQRFRPQRRKTLAVLLNDGWWPNLAALGLLPAWACGYCYRRRLDTRYQPERLASASWLNSAVKVDSEVHLVLRAAMAAKPALGGAFADLSSLEELRQKLLSEPLAVPPAWAKTEQWQRIVLHAGTRGGRKQWPISRWRAVAAALLAQRQNYHLTFTGGPNEIEMVKAIAAGLPFERIWLAAGPTSLRELGAIFAQAGCLVAPDCGPAHLASAVGCPTAVLMGATFPTTCAPFWPPSRVLFKAATPLPLEMVEMQSNEPHPNMLAIAPDEVLASVVELRQRKAENVEVARQEA